MKTNTLFFVFLTCMLACMGCESDNSIALRNIRIRQEIDILQILKKKYKDYHYNYFEDLLYERLALNTKYQEFSDTLNLKESLRKIEKAKEADNLLHALIRECRDYLPKNVSTISIDSLPILLETAPVQQRIIKSGKIEILEAEIKRYELVLMHLFGEKIVKNASLFSKKTSFVSKYFEGANIITALQGLQYIEIDIQQLYTKCIQAYIAEKHPDIRRIFEPSVFVEKNKVTEGEEYFASIGINSWEVIYPNLTCNGQNIPLNPEGIGVIRIKPRTVGKHQLKGQISKNGIQSGEIQTITKDFDINFEVLPNK